MWPASWPWPRCCSRSRSGTTGPSCKAKWWDDLNHFANWALLTAAVGLLLRCTTLPRVPCLGLAIGFGATTAILWELGEYLSFVQNSTERFTAYRDTMGDQALGLAGSVLGGWLSTRQRWIPG